MSSFNLTTNLIPSDRSNRKFFLTSFGIDPSFENTIYNVHDNNLHLGSQVVMSGDGNTIVWSSHKSIDAGNTTLETSGEIKVYRKVANQWTIIGAGGNVEDLIKTDYAGFTPINMGTSVAISFNGNRIVVITSFSSIYIFDYDDINDKWILMMNGGSTKYINYNSGNNNTVFDKICLSGNGNVVAVSIVPNVLQTSIVGEVKMYNLSTITETGDIGTLSSSSYSFSEIVNSSLTTDYDAARVTGYGVHLTLDYSGNIIGISGRREDRKETSPNNIHQLVYRIELYDISTFSSPSGPMTINTMGNFGIPKLSKDGTTLVVSIAERSTTPVISSFENSLYPESDNIFNIEKALYVYTRNASVWNLSRTIENDESVSSLPNIKRFLSQDYNNSGAGFTNDYINDFHVSNDGTKIITTYRSNTNLAVSRYTWNGSSWSSETIITRNTSTPTDNLELSRTALLMSNAADDQSVFSLIHVSADSGLSGYTESNNYLREIDIYAESISEGGQTTTKVPCFGKGTKILALRDGKEEYCPIETLQAGHYVKTLINGYIPIYKIGSRKMFNPSHNNRIKDRLYKLTPNRYPELQEDLYLTGCHSVLVDSLSEEQEIKARETMGNWRLYKTDEKYRLWTMNDERAVPFTSGEDITVWHFALEHDHEDMNYAIYANGLLVECTSKMRMDSYF